MRKWVPGNSQHVAESRPANSPPPVVVSKKKEGRLISVDPRLVGEADLLLLFVDDLVVCFDHVVGGLGRTVTASRRSRSSGLTSLRLCAGLALLLVERLPSLAEHL